MGLRDKLVDPRSPDRRPRRSAYVLPSLFTAGNIFLGYISIQRTLRAAMASTAGDAASAADLFAGSAVAIGIAVLLDGLDGRIARMTNTVSEFGREMDSLADVISFGIAPSLLAYAWGVQFVDHSISDTLRGQLNSAGYFVAFLFLLCGAARLARFNVQKNPVPRNPGRPDRKYFVGLPIPAAAGMVAAAVFVMGGVPIDNVPLAVCWLGTLGLLAFLMVSTWRYHSFKGVNLSQPRGYLILVLAAACIYAIWAWPKEVLLALALLYVGSGIVVRIGGGIRRKWRAWRARDKESSIA
jgi:CDP-diacylglycerol---serine O-phosphatidyltransferase